jgi:hypothetical protein
MAHQRIETDRFVLHREVDERGAIISSRFEMPDGSMLSEREYVAAANEGIPPAWYAEQQQPFAQRRAPHRRLQLVGRAVVVLALVQLALIAAVISLWRS